MLSATCHCISNYDELLQQILAAFITTEHMEIKYKWLSGTYVSYVIDISTLKSLLLKFDYLSNNEKVISGSQKNFGIFGISEYF